MNQDDPNNPKGAPQTRVPQGQGQPQQQQFAPQQQQTFAPGQVQQPQPGQQQFAPGQPQRAGQPQQQFAPQGNPNFPNTPSQPLPNPSSGQFPNPNTGQFPNPNSASFSTNTAGFSIAIPQEEEAFDVTLKIRAIYAASGFFLGILAGLFLGILNCLLESTDVLESVDIILEISIWMGLFTGGVAALKPRQFENVFEQIKERFGGEE